MPPREALHCRSKLWNSLAPSSAGSSPSLAGRLDSLPDPLPDPPAPLPPPLPSPSRSGGRAAQALTELGDPPLDWVALATGLGVPASRATTAEELAAAVAAGLARTGGPTLIEALLL